MDPNLATVLLGLFTNGLAAFIAQLGHRDSRLLLGGKLHSKIKLEQTALEPTLQKATAAIIEKIEWRGIPSLEVVCLFLSSPEAEAIIRQIYAAQLSENENRADWAAIQEEFLASFHLFTTSYAAYADLVKDQLKELSNLLLQTILEGCEQALNTAIDKGILAAHEAKSTFRYRVLLDELTALRENVLFLTAQRRPGFETILDFERAYRQQVGNRHRYITPPNFDKVRKFPIDDLYVLPKIVPNKKVEGPEKTTELTMPTFLSGIYRAVLLGNPGGGKSSFALKLCHDLATRYSERIFAERREVTPILVVLREYGAKKKTDNCSILEFIQTKANADYQVAPPVGAFEYLLRNGRAAVIFDGLDELLDTSYRQEISNDVDSFCNLYPSVPILVTSREVGYEQAPLDEERFEVFRLASFDKEQAHAYAQKWFSTITDLTPEQQKQKAESFLEESELVTELRSNPLMIALLCNIYQEENYIPRNRPDVYEKCATMLFERWDRSRGIHPSLPFEAQIRPAMMYLAHWIYANEELRGGVTEERLVKKTTEYLRQRRFEDPDEARKAAKEFIAFCRGRAWVFTDVGTTKEGEKLYQFTHQTFLEYFTAAHVCRTHATPASLIQFLRPRIAKREWDVVAQLALHIQNKYVEGAGDKGLTLLLGQVHEVEKDTIWSFLSFIVRCLEFLIPSPKVIHSITSTFMQLFLAWGNARLQTEGLPGDYSSDFVRPASSIYDPNRIFRNLLNSAIENCQTIAPLLEKILINQIKNGSELEALMAAEISQTLSNYFRITQVEARDFWQRVQTRIFDDCSEQIAILRQKYLVLSYGAYDISDMVKWHGPQSIFREPYFIMQPDTRWIPAAENLIFSLLDPSDDAVRRGHSYSRLKEIGSAFLTYPSPWITTQVLQECFPPTRNRELDGSRKLLDLDSDTLFGAFILLAVLVEASNLPDLKNRERISQVTAAIQHSFQSTFIG